MRNVTQRCSDFYSFFKEDEGNYSLGWRKNNASLTFPSPWKYQTRSQLGNYPYMGTFGTYGGGGYVMDLRYTDETYDLIKELQDNNWIDMRTRAVFVDIAIYSAQVNLFGIATFLTEWLPTNGVLYFNNVKVARLYSNNDALSMAMMVSQIFMAVFVFVFLYNEFKMIYKMRSKYLKDPWNWLELTQICLIFGCAGTLYKRSYYTSTAIALMKTNPTSFVSLLQASTWDELFTYLLGFLVFFATLKLLKLFRFNHTVFLLTRTLASAASPLMSFFLVFLVFYIAYAIVFYVVYGSKVQEYCNFISTVETLFNTLLGGFDYTTIEENNRELGPILFFSFMIFVVLVLMNVFLTIIMDSFSEVQADEDLQSNGYGVADFLKEHIASVLWRSGNAVDAESQDPAETHMGSVAEPMDQSSHANEDDEKSSLSSRRSSASHDAILPSDNENQEPQFFQPKRVLLEDKTKSSPYTDVLIQFYDSLDRAVDARQLRDDRKVNFDFSNYQSRTYPANRLSSDVSASYLPLEPAVEFVQKCFARVAIDDIDEDQILEILFRSYVARKYYVPFEEEDTKDARQLEKMKWKYTRHMFDP